MREFFSFLCGFVFSLVTESLLNSEVMSTLQLAEKRKAFMEMTEEQKKEAKAKAAGSRAEAKQAAANKGSDLVVVNMSCTAPDKVVITLDYPALAGA